MAFEAHSQASEALKHYVTKDLKDRRVLVVPEGKYKGWIPRSVYSMHLDEVYLPFLRLQSFPVGGTSLGNLVGMKTFHAVGNYLYKLSNSFSNCKELERLNLSFNHFVTISPSVFKLTNLIELDLSDNDLEEIPPEIGNLKCLKVLNLSGNIISSVPSELSSCKRLEKLNLSKKLYPKDGGFTELPVPVCKLKELQQLDVSWHQIHTIPDEVEHLTKLQSLNLKGNYLKYVSTKISQCKKLQILDLTGAMKLNSYIPSEIFLLEELKILNISGNYFTEISSEIYGLKNLRMFIMRRNALLRLPPELFSLENLESLQLSDNYLQDIPPLIRNLKHLKYLDLLGNKLESLPDDLCECYSLENLTVANNMLKSLPNELYKLSNLEELNIENNMLRELPLLLDKLDMLGKTRRLSIRNNYLVQPPQTVCDQGITSLYQFLRELRISEAKHRKKMILIGSAKAGKTSLRNALVLGRSKLTLEHERTWVLERHLWEPQPDLRIQILDFGGHHIYSAAHQMFLTPEALHILVFDLKRYVPEEYNALIGDWIDAIIDRAPGAIIQIVGTHADLCKPTEIGEKVTDVLERMHTEENAKIEDLKIEREKLVQKLQNIKESDQDRISGSRFEDLGPQRMQEKLKYLERIIHTRISLPTRINIVSCAEDLRGVKKLRHSLESKLSETEERPFPRLWYRFLMAIQERKEKLLHWEQAILIFKDVMEEMKQSMISQQGSAESSLEVILKYLHSTGEIVWYYDNPKLKGIVFHRPDTLVEMLRAVFRHDFEKVVTYDDRHGRISNINQNKFTMMKSDFLSQGLMTLELLHYCLLHFQLSIEAKDMFVDLMLKFDLCYEVPKMAGAPATLASSRILRFPWFLSTDVPDSVGLSWPDRASSDVVELRIQFLFQKKLPPNVFEKLSARLQSHVLKREDWKDGTLAQRNKTKILVTRKKISGGNSTVVNMSVRGSDLQELWFLLKNARIDLLGLLQEWPFAQFEQNLFCSHCVMRGDVDPFLYPAEVLDMTCPKGIYMINCQKEKNDLVPACFVYPLDSEFQDDIGEHIKVVNEFLQGLMDTVDGAGLLTDMGLSYVASRLGVEWSLVALNLGLSQPEIEQIQLDNPYQTVRQTTTALVRWRERQKNDPEDDILKVLLETLKRCERADLVRELKEKYGITGIDVSDAEN